MSFMSNVGSKKAAEEIKSCVAYLKIEHRKDQWALQALEEVEILCEDIIKECETGSY